VGPLWRQPRGLNHRAVGPWCIERWCRRSGCYRERWEALGPLRSQANMMLRLVNRLHCRRAPRALVPSVHPFRSRLAGIQVLGMRTVIKSLILGQCDSTSALMNQEIAISSSTSELLRLCGTSKPFEPTRRAPRQRQPNHQSVLLHGNRFVYGICWPVGQCSAKRNKHMIN
jgi:hypothetical protein